MANNEQIIKTAFQGWNDEWVAALIKCTNTFEAFTDLETVAVTNFSTKEETNVSTWIFKVNYDNSARIKTATKNFIATQITKFFNTVTDNDCSFKQINHFVEGDSLYFIATYSIS